MIKIIFGVVVVLLGIEMLLREKQEKKGKKSPVVLAVVGILSGILCGLFGVGALLAAYVNRTTENTSEFKGNLCAVFIFENTFRLVLYAMTDLLTWQTVKKCSVSASGDANRSFYGDGVWENTKRKSSKKAGNTDADVIRSFSCGNKY